MKLQRISFIVLFVILISASAGSVHAADDAVYLSTDSAHYRFAVNEESRIPVAITNTMAGDIPGTLHVNIRDPQTGEYVYSQSKQLTAFTGEEMYYISAGNSVEEQDIIVDISFEYGNGPVYKTELKGIGLSFSDEELPDEDTTEEKPDTTPVTGTSEIKAETTDAGASSYQPDTTDGDVNAVEEYSDADALKRTLLEEQIEREMRKNALATAIQDDTLFQTTNTTLYDQNFSAFSLVVNPHGNESSIFSSLYGNANDETVTLTGAVTGGKVSYILENTTAAIALPATYTENKTFRDGVSGILSERFVRTGTEINTSVHHADVTVQYEKGIYHAEIRAESVDGNVTAVTIQKDDILPFYVLPILILAFASLNALIVYAWYTMRPGDAEPKEPDTTEHICPAEYATELLKSAELLFAGGHKTEAVSTAVRALRMHISAGQGVEKEVSDRECRESLLEEQGQNLNPKIREQTLTILQTTEMQRFAAVDITEEQFRALIDTVKEIIQG